MRLDHREDLLLQRQVFERRFHHVIGTGDGFAQVGHRVDAIGGADILAQVTQIAANAVAQRVQVGLIGVLHAHIMPTLGKDLRDAVAHQPGADHRDACEGHPAEYPPSASRICPV